MRSPTCARGLAVLLTLAAAAPAGAQDAPPAPLAPPPAAEARRLDDLPVAVLGGLDKITARTTTLMVPVGQAARFGQLDIAVRACRKAPPIEPPESAAFLEIAETQEGRAQEQRFSGWMFASSPALSAMDHAVYDVWVIDCRKSATNVPASSAPGGPKQ